MTAMLLTGGLFAAAHATAPVSVPPGTPVLREPAVVTTCGQSPGALMVKVMCDEAKVECVQADLLKPEQLAAGKFKTLIVTMGTSLKGMGAAGVNVDSELRRIRAVLAEARRLKLTVVGVQLEGPSRRTDETDEASIRTVAPESDLLIIRSDVNGDGYFTRVAAEKKIPLILIKEALDVKALLPVLFKKPA
ncbi:MAG: DUF6305 family protein, partial [Armatimonadota bacterium]|nr:DUF6305 family protein [Armatimonadota bacterium]